MVDRVGGFGKECIVMHDRSEALFKRARGLLPGGVSSPVRAFGAVGGTPPFIARGKGAYLWDEDGNRYVDMVCSWGALVAGHAEPSVVEAISRAAERGSSFGAPTELELRLAERIRRAMPNIEMVRFVSSGTEATMSAIRLARAATGRDGIVKFAGCYHGHADMLLAQAGSGALTFGTPTSPGVPADAARHTYVLPYNDNRAVRALFAEPPEPIAAVIVEPVAANMGVVPPAEGFLPALAATCQAGGALLIFDEVITGFRVGRGGAQERFGVTPDLTCLGKIIGGGMPAGAYGGQRDLMEQMAPSGPVYQAGTLSGNPVAMAAGIATLDHLTTSEPYARLDELGRLLREGLIEAARQADVPICVNRVGGLVSPFFRAGPVTDLASAQRSDAERYARFFHAMLEQGIYMAPSQFEAMFPSLAHSDADVAAVIAAARQALARVKE